MVVVLLGSLALQGCAVAALTADGFAGGTEIKHTVSFALLGLAQRATFVMSLIRWFSTAHDTFWFGFKELGLISCGEFRRRVGLVDAGSVFCVGSEGIDGDEKAAGEVCLDGEKNDRLAFQP